MRADTQYVRYASRGTALVVMLMMATSAWAQTNGAPPQPATPAPVLTLPALTLPAGIMPAPRLSPATTPSSTTPAPVPQARASMEIYGFAMLDIGQNFKTINPNWFDTMRVTKLPSFAGQYGEDNSAFAGVRQSRLGVKATTPTALGDLKTTFEFELFGIGRGRGTDHVPSAARLRRTRPLRRRPDVERVHGSGRVPELARVLGTDRHGVLPQRAVPLHARHGQSARRQPDADVRARTAGRQRRPRHARGPHRAPEHQGPQPDARLHRRLHASRATGATSASAGVVRRIAWDDMLDDELRTERQARPAGA